MVQSLKQKASKELALLHVEILDIPLKIPKITMAQAQEIVFKESQGAIVYEGEKKGPKVTIVRYKAKSNRDRKIGHRQKYAKVKIEAIK